MEIIAKQEHFGRLSEEVVCNLDVAEPKTLEVSKQPKCKGKKESDLADIPIKRINYYMSDTELEAEFGVNSWKQLPDAISKKYSFVPAKVEVEEYHVGVYAGKADYLKGLLHKSLISPSLAAAIINGKYMNAMPLYRLEQEFQSYGLNITRQNMANWCIRLGEEYLSVLYEHLHKVLLHWNLLFQVSVIF